VNQRPPPGSSRITGATRVPARPWDGPTATTEDSALLRLAFWLAEVSAEAARVATASAANANGTGRGLGLTREPKTPAAGPTT
jgi:hypothetical protein